MSDKETLEEAVLIVLESGWELIDIEPFKFTNFKVALGAVDNIPHWIRFFDDTGTEITKDLESVIYNHDFAKALWGGVKSPIHIDDYTGSHRQYVKPVVEWQFHLQQMVIAKDPIAYLRDNLPKTS